MDLLGLMERGREMGGGVRERGGERRREERERERVCVCTGAFCMAVVWFVGECCMGMGWDEMS